MSFLWARQLGLIATLYIVGHICLNVQCTNNRLLGNLLSADFLAWFKMEVNGRNGRWGGNTEEKEDEERVKLLPTFGPPNFTNVDIPFGTVCRTMWSLLRLCRPSVGVWKQFCSRPHSLTLSSTTVNLLPTLSGYWWFYYLDHSKNTWLIGGCAYRWFVQKRVTLHAYGLFIS